LGSKQRSSKSNKTQVALGVYLLPSGKYIPQISAGAGRVSAEVC
jgi:hypothetical protein